MAFDAQGALAAGYGPQEIAEHLSRQSNFDLNGAVSSGYSYEDVISHLSQGGNSPAQEAPQEGGTLSDIGRGLGLGTRNVLEGVGSITEPFVMPLNAINSWIGGDPNYFKGNVGRELSNLAGLPNPGTENERLLSDVQRGAAGALGGYGVGAALQASQAAKPIADMLKTAPFMQGASGATAGYGAGMARESGASPGLQMAAGLAGGLAAPAGASVGALGWRGLGGTRTALDAWTPGGRNRIAGQTLNRLATNKDASLAALAAGAEELIPDSLPTLAQASGDTGLAVLEKGLVSSGPKGGALQQRYLDQRAAQQAAIRGELESTAPFGGNLETGDVGTRVRTAFDTNYAAAKDRTRAAYGAIDPEGTASFAPSPLSEAADTALAKYFGPGSGKPHPEIAAVVEELRQAARQFQEPPVTLSGNSSGIVGRLNQNVADYLPGGQAGDIRLSQATIDAINQKHGAQYRKVGFDGAEDFVRHILQNMDAVYPTRGSYDLLTRRMTPYGKTTVEPRLETPPGVYEATSAYPVRADSYKNKNPLWERAQSNQSENGLPRAISGQSGYENSIQQVPAGGNGLSYRYLQNMRSRLSELENKAAMGGERRTSAAANSVRESIDGMIENSAGAGFTPQQAELFRIAKEARTIQGKRFESGANTAMSRRGGSLEGTQVPTSQVPEHYFRAGEKGGESMRAFNLAAGNSPDARQAMADYAISQGIRKATRNSGEIDLDGLTRWASSHKPALDQLGLGKITSMPKVRADINRANDATRKAGVKGSPTAQNLATQAIIDRIVGDYRINADTSAVGSLASSVVTGIPRLLTDKAGKLFFGPANEAVSNILTDAALDPSLALRLMENAAYVPRMNIADILKDAAKAYGATALRTPGMSQTTEKGR